MISPVRLVLVSLVVLAAESGCLVSTSGGPGIAGDGGTPARTSAEGGAASPATPVSAGAATPDALVGTWTAGRGGTTVAYDTITGTSSSNASGLAFQFAADGTFAKAYRDSTGGSCSTIFVATESGTVAWGDRAFRLESSHGTTRTFSSCSPSLVSSQPMAQADLDQAAYTYELDGDEMVLTRESDASTARFRRSQ